MKRIIVGLPGDLLKRADAVAREEGLARTEIVRRALETLIERRREEKEREARLRKRQEALRGIESLGEVFGSVPTWRPGEIIREWRDRDRLEQHPSRESVVLPPKTRRAA